MSQNLQFFFWQASLNERFCYKFYFVRQFQIPDTLIAWPFSCFTLLGASLKIDTFPLCELTIINYYWTNSEQELWKMRQKTACPGCSESDILMPFWQTRERERIQTSFRLLLSHHLQPAVVNKHSSENYFMHHLIETLLHFVRDSPLLRTCRTEVQWMFHRISYGQKCSNRAAASGVTI